MKTKTARHKAGEYIVSAWRVQSVLPIRWLSEAALAFDVPARAKAIEQRQPKQQFGGYTGSTSRICFYDRRCSASLRRERIILGGDRSGAKLPASKKTRMYDGKSASSW